MKQIIMFDSEHELEQHVKGRLNAFLTSLYYLSFDIPQYGKFIWYNEREECKWLFCTLCQTRFVGLIRENEILFWHDNYHSYFEGNRIGEPGRLCPSCLKNNQALAMQELNKRKRINITENDLWDIYHCSLLPDGSYLYDLIPLEGEELEKWHEEYGSRKIPRELEIDNDATN